MNDAGRLYARMTWRGFLRARRREPDARVLLTVGGQTPGETADRIEAAAKSGRIDAASYVVRSEICEKLTRIYESDAAVYSEELDRSDWQPLGHGAHRRITHVGHR